MKKDTGGDAFPSPGVVIGLNQQGAYEGMTLRDYFAAHAPISWLDAVTAFHMEHGRDGIEVEQMFKLAELRGAYADAMIAERAK